MGPRWISWTLGATVGALALAGGIYLGGRTMAPSVPAADVGTNPVLALALPDARGVELPFSQWRGKVLVVNFWATWCAPCREEMPMFMRLQQQYGGKGLQFVGIAADQADKVREFEKEIHLNYPTAVAGYGAVELSQTLGNRVGALPFTVVVGRDGRIVHAQLGPFDEKKLNGIIAQLL